MKLLLIEDDAGMIKRIPECLAIGGIRVSTMRDVDNLHDGTNLALDMNPDVVILDLGLRGTLPHETVAGSRHLCRSYPVIVLTGYDNPEYWRTMVEHGASDYLFKGVFMAPGNELFLAHAVNTARYRRVHFDSYGRE